MLTLNYFQKLQENNICFYKLTKINLVVSATFLRAPVKQEKKYYFTSKPLFILEIMNF